MEIVKTDFYIVNLTLLNEYIPPYEYLSVSAYLCCVNTSVGYYDWSAERFKALQPIEINNLIKLDLLLHLHLYKGKCYMLSLLQGQA